MDIIIGIGIVLGVFIMGRALVLRQKRNRQQAIDGITESDSVSCLPESGDGPAADDASSYDAYGSEPKTCQHGLDPMHCSICGPTDRMC